VAIPARNGVNSSQSSRDMNHTGIPAPSHAAMVLPSPSEFSPSYRKLDTGMLTRRHCRRSPQEIKCWLWYAGSHLAARESLPFSLGRCQVSAMCAAASPFTSSRAQQGKPINFKAMS
jgi:hypothetical protein